ncbi:hypothetical protein CAP36_07865 [Chitinophagaceae bacterium IBVUCB2]|nr:hypothetical protein CAP36_07865 [Chitinophagaceae bacterium IBVUCB2]
METTNDRLLTFSKYLKFEESKLWYNSAEAAIALSCNVCGLSTLQLPYIRFNDSSYYLISDVEALKLKELQNKI